MSGPRYTQPFCRYYIIFCNILIILKNDIVLSVFLDISPELQRERISRRNTPEKANRFFAEWIPMEQAYFAAFDIPAKCTLCLPIL